MKYFKVFNTESEYHAYIQGDDFIAPNVSTLYDCTKTWILEGREVIHVTGVTLNKSSISIVKDKTFKLEATVTPNDAADKSVTWSSSNENVATVDSNGVVSGVASGDATITVTTVDGGFTAQCSVSVSNHDYSEEYLSFTALEDATFKFTKATQYSIDGGDTWVALQSNTYTPTISAGDKIYWKASLSGNTSAGTFSSTGEYNACGNPMSLLYNDDFVGKTTMGNNNFFDLFLNNTKLISISDLSLPATTLATNCYMGMFSGCTSLTDTITELPATTMANECYRGMFDGCSNITNISFTLPAMTMADGCYRAMFANCTNLTETIELPATTLAESCYRAMFDACEKIETAPTLPAEIVPKDAYHYLFYKCYKLNYIKCLATDISASSAVTEWVGLVSNTGVFIKNESMTGWGNGANGIPTGWEVFDNGVTVSSVTVNPSILVIKKDETYDLTPITYPKNAYNRVTWSSSDATIATVDSNGVVSGVSSGDAVITVTAVNGGLTAQCAVKVYQTEYTELEYIASTSNGGQYIDLDIMLYDTLNKWYDIAIKFNVTGVGKDGDTQPTLFGCQENISPWPGTFIRKSSSNTVIFGRYIGGGNKDNNLTTVGTDKELSAKTAPDKNVYNLNNGGKAHTWGTSLFCIFDSQDKTVQSRFIEAKLYYFKLFLKENENAQGLIVRDMMPCKRNSDNAIGLLDKVNNVFYSSPNGVAFVAGPEVNA